MGVVFRQSIKSAIIVLTGNLIGALVNYCSTYVFKDNQQQFGFSKTLLTVGNLSMVMVLLGAASTIQIYTQKYPATDKRKKVLITFCTIIPLATTLVLLPFYLIFKEQLVQIFKPDDRPYLSAYYLWIPFLTLMWSYLTLYEAYMVSQHKAAKSLLIREIFLRVFNIGTLVALYFHVIDFHGFITWTILSYVLAVLFQLLLSGRTEGFGFSLDWKLFSKKEYKEIIHFSWFHLLMGIAFYLNGYLDTLMLAVYDKKGMSALPVYIIAGLIAQLVYIPYRAIVTAVFPVLNKAYIDGDKEELKDVFNRSGINLLIVAIAMMLMIGLNLNNAVAILPKGKGYDVVLPLALILMLGRLFEMASGLNNEMISISSLYKFNSRVSIGLVLLLTVLYRIWIPVYGVYGAAWGTTISLMIYNVAKTIFLYKKMGLQPFSAKSPLVLVAGLITGGIVYCIPFLYHPVLDAFIRTGIIVIIYTLLLLWLRPSEDMNSYLASISKNKRLF